MPRRFDLKMEGGHVVEEARVHTIIGIDTRFCAMRCRTVEEAFDGPRFGAFLTTAVAFFVVEIGDKTQIATIALGAQFQSVLLVTLGTTAGMMAANVPAVYLGNAIVGRVSLKLVRSGAALSFAAIGLWILADTIGIISQ